MYLVFWICSALVFIGGGAWYLLEVMVRPLHEIEVAGMRQGGRFEGEPEFMQTFRVARALGEYFDHNLRMQIAVRVMCTGGLAILVLVAATLLG